MKKLFRKNDLFLIGALILLGLVVMFIINITKADGSKVKVTINGNEYETLPLDKNTTYTVTGDNGEWNTFVIKDGYIDMVDASCPDKLCVKHRNIHFSHETIVCLPNKVVLEVIGGEENGVDATAD